MPNILILGANGQIARAATGLFLKRTDAHLTLYLRSAKRLKLSGHADRVRIAEGDVLDTKALDGAMAGQDVVYASDLGYTILRLASRKSVAGLVVKRAMTPGLESRRSLGVHKE